MITSVCAILRYFKCILLSPGQLMPTFIPTNAIVGHLLGTVGHCWMWGGQTNPTLVPKIYLLITATATATTTTTQNQLLYSLVPNTRPLPPLIFIRKIFKPLLLCGAPLTKFSRRNVKKLGTLVSYPNNDINVAKF